MIFTPRNYKRLIPPLYLNKLPVLYNDLKAPPPPYDLENYCINRHHISHAHLTNNHYNLTHVSVGIFLKFAILTILQQFQNRK